MSHKRAWSAIAVVLSVVGVAGCSARDSFSPKAAGVEVAAGVLPGAVKLSVSGETCRDGLAAKTDLHGNEVRIKVKAYGKCHAQMNFEPMSKSVTTDAIVNLRDGDYRIVVSDGGPKFFVHWEHGVVGRGSTQEEAKAAWARLPRSRAWTP